MPRSEQTSANARWTEVPNSAAYLQRQQAEARMALEQTVRELKHDIAGVLDPKTWVRISPWATLGVAAAAGFAAAAAVVPARQMSTNPGEAPAQATPPVEAAPSPRNGKASGAVWAAVSTGLYGLARVALTEIISGALRVEPLREPESTDVELDLSA